MFFRFLYLNSVSSRMHSTDLSDMKSAILEEEDQDGPDGGSADCSVHLTQWPEPCGSQAGLLSVHAS